MKKSTPLENTKMFLFARWISTCYADTHLDSKGRCEHDYGFDRSDSMSVLNMEDGDWWKSRLAHFNKTVYPNYVKNSSAKHTKEFLKGL